jgi:hypothetical protein
MEEADELLPSVYVPAEYADEVFADLGTLLIRPLNRKPFGSWSWN